MLKWLLISSISLVSFSMLMFQATYFAIFDQAQIYYQVEQRWKITLMSNIFNVGYLVLTPILFSVIKPYYIPIVLTATLTTAIGCIGRFLVAPDYSLALAFSALVGVSQVPIITAPYGLLNLFKKEMQGYASSIPLFVPILGIDLSILYGLIFIAGTPNSPDLAASIDHLHAIIAVVSVVAALVTFICFYLLGEQIRSSQKGFQEEDSQNLGCLARITRQFGRGKQFFVLVLAWGLLLGVNWTYGSMFQIIFMYTGLESKGRAIIGLCANLSSAIFSNVGTFIANRSGYSRYKIILTLNLFGLGSSVFIFLTSLVKVSIFHNLLILTLAVVILRAGFTSFTALALLELKKSGMATVLISAIFFYAANAVNLCGNLLVDFLSNQISLAIMLILVLLALYIVHQNKGYLQQQKGGSAISFNTSQLHEQQSGPEELNSNHRE